MLLKADLKYNYEIDDVSLFETDNRFYFNSTVLVLELQIAIESCTLNYSNMLHVSAISQYSWESKTDHGNYRC